MEYHCMKYPPRHPAMPPNSAKSGISEHSRPNASARPSIGKGEKPSIFRYPPNEIRDRKSPSDRDVNAPDAYASIEQIGNSSTEEQEESEGNCECSKPQFATGMLQRNIGDLI